MRLAITALTVLATTTAARADAPTSPQLYVGAGPLVGVDAGAYAGATLEGGYRLNDALWVRGFAAGARESGFWSQTSGHASAFRVGAETRHRVASTSNVVGFVAGVDLGIKSISVVSDNDADMRLNGTRFVVVPRAGLDLGTDHVRLRLCAELGIADLPVLRAGMATHELGTESLGLIATLAYER